MVRSGCAVEGERALLLLPGRPSRGVPARLLGLLPLPPARLPGRPPASGVACRGVYCSGWSPCQEPPVPGRSASAPLPGCCMGKREGEVGRAKVPRCSSCTTNKGSSASVSVSHVKDEERDDDDDNCDEQVARCRCRCRCCCGFRFRCRCCCCCAHRQLRISVTRSPCHSRPAQWIGGLSNHLLHLFTEPEVRPHGAIGPSRTRRGA